MPRLFTHPTDPVAAAEYRVSRATAAASDLLDAGASEWARHAGITWGHDRYRTTFRAVWTADALVARFDCDDNAPWWTMGERDDELWNEEVVEIFVDPLRQGRGYAEVEISPANVVCDLRIAEPWPSLSGDRTWDWGGLETRVTRNPSGHWTAVVVLPFEGLAGLSGEVAGVPPPAPGDRWRFNVFRIKRPHGPSDPDRDVIYAAWAVPDGPSFHDPSVFRELVFAG